MTLDRAVFLKDFNRRIVYPAERGGVRRAIR